MERAGARTGRSSSRPGTPRRPRRRTSAARATTEATGSSSHRLLRERGTRGSTCCCWRQPGAARRTPPPNLPGLPGASRPRPVQPPKRPWATHGVVIDAILGTGFSGRAARAGHRGAIEAINALPDATVGIACDVPQWRRRLDRRDRGRRRTRADATATFHAGQARPVDLPGQDPCRRTSPSSTSGFPPATPGWRLDRADRRQRPGIKCPTSAAASRPSSRSVPYWSAAARAGLTGAPCMVSEAAMRAGAGYVTALSPRVAESGLRAAPARGDVGPRCPIAGGSAPACRRPIRFTRARKAGRRAGAGARAWAAPPRRRELSPGARTRPCSCRWCSMPMA